VYDGGDGEGERKKTGKNVVSDAKKEFFLGLSGGARVVNEGVKTRWQRQVCVWKL
jgi:hypothetical protein